MDTTLEFSPKYIDWEDENSYVFVRPSIQLSAEERKTLLQRLPPLKGHIWIASSGSSKLFSSITQFVGLSKRACLSSAESVNRHLDVTAKDIWLRAIPDFHVGGLSIFARAFLKSIQVLSFTSPKTRLWDAPLFFKTLVESNATLTSLVPAQVYDLVQLKYPAPRKLRAVVVGGDSLAPPIYALARQLGWNLLPSYGCTECSSQIATADLRSLETYDFPKMKILSHIHIENLEDDQFRIQSQSLFTGYAFYTREHESVEFEKRQDDGWVSTDKGGSDRGRNFKFLGRQTDFINIGGEKVSLKNVRDQYCEAASHLEGYHTSLITALEDSRLGHVIGLLTTQSTTGVALLVDAYNKTVLPYLRVRRVHQVRTLPFKNQPNIMTKLNV